MTGARVLLCDDCVPVRELVRLVLELEGIEVVSEVGDGGAAIEEAGRCQPDVVLLDLSMPAMDGLEALPEICRAAPHAKVVVLSGFDNPLIVERALELGAVRYVEKGSRPEEIVAAVEEAAGG
ncbi:MAG: response regulator [Gaiellaceae bacterium]|jgi:DNA-binding NarL/FixJ family response regulator